MCSGAMMWPFKKKPAEVREAMGEPPAIDVNQPVENPRLTAAIADFAAGSGAGNLERLLLELNQAVYLVAILDDELTFTPGETPGKGTIAQGSKIKVMMCSDESGAGILPVFSDWRQIRAWTEAPVSTLVMPAGDVWDWVTGKSEHAGAVVNPGGMALPLSLDQVLDLRRRLTSGSGG